MSATVFILPVVARPNFEDPAWIEQRQRELDALREAPGRTRPMLVSDPMQVAVDNFHSVMRTLVDVFADDVQRPSPR